MAVATCAECDEEIEVSDRARVGQRVVCPNCGARLDIVSTAPLELETAYDEEEDWEDDDDFDDFDDDDFDDWEDDEFDSFDDDDFDDLDDDDEKW
ncbi:MAG: hypothetical protein R3E79_04845 [Caldilineaceae bacterium]